MIKVKQLFFDIETVPNIGLFWEAGYKKYPLRKYYSRKKNNLYLLQMER